LRHRAAATPRRGPAWIGSEEYDVAPVWLAQSEEKLDRRRFAGTVPAEERDDLALVDPEADV
jgi:hypothetical protein